MKRPAILATLLISACSTKSPPSIPLEGWALRGCDGVLEPETCELFGENTLTAWVPARATDPVTVLADSNSLQVQRTVRADGVGLEFAVPKNTSELTLVVQGEPERRASFSVVHSSSTAPSAARMMLEQARLKQNESANEAVELFDRAANLARSGSKKERWIELRARLIATYHLAFSLGDASKAAALLKQAPAPGPLDGEGLIRLRIHQAQLADRFADPRAALELLDDAERWGERLDSTYRLRAKHDRAIALSKLGRHSDACNIMLQLLEVKSLDHRCFRLDILSNAAWIEIQRDRTHPGIRSWLEEAAQLSRDGCGGDEDQNDISVNLAYYELSNGNREAARAALNQIKGGEYALTKLWRLLLDARIDPTLEKFEALRRTAEENIQPEVAWRARVESGKLEEEHGRLSRALDHYVAAEALVSAAGDAAPFGEGRFALREERAASADGLIRVLLAQKKPAEAMAAARTARRRNMLDAGGVSSDPSVWNDALSEYHGARARFAEASEAGWGISEADRPRYEAELASLRAELRRALDAVLQKRTIPAIQRSRESELRRPEKNEGIFITWSLGQEYFGFLQTTEKTTIVSTRAPKAADWLELLEPQLKKISRLTVIAGASDGTLQLSQSSFAGRPLLEHLSVVYSADLPARTATIPSATAFIAADAARDLSRARTEAAEVGEHLRARGWRTSTALGEEASRSKVQVELARVSLLHYAGHGRFAGAEGFDSALQLAGGDLTVGEIVTATTSPTWVVLSSCETAQSASTEKSAGLGVASAFLIAGAEAVLASDISIGDARAARFMSRLYQSWPGASSIEDAYRKAMLEIGAEDASFRLLVR